MATLTHPSIFSFTLGSPFTKNYGPRLGAILLQAPDPSNPRLPTQIPTPTFLAATSRGLVPHLSHDNQHITPSIRWVNIPFETFTEHNPPLPTLYPGKDPLHTFLGYTPGRQIVSLSARDPDDGRQMPPNGNTALSVYTLRGVRKISPTDWRSYTLKCQPDVVFAISDIPFTDPPYSQKRLTKSITRSAAWLTTLLRPISTSDYPAKLTNNTSESKADGYVSVAESSVRMPAILLHMSGGTCMPARRAFSASLLEPLCGLEAEAVKPFKTLDEGVTGYTFDLKPLRQALEASERKQNGKDLAGIMPPTHANSTNSGLSGSSDSEPDSSLPLHTTGITPLMQTSLARLPREKLRLVNSTEGPHEILKYISDVGVDVFDAGWVQRAANNGVGLDFEFPVKRGTPEGESKREIGHDLYDSKYEMDFGTIADTFRGGYSVTNDEDTRSICICAACSPRTPQDKIYHGVDTLEFTHSNCVSEQNVIQPPYVRAYIHHLLHTHEMSAHALLVMHNLAVLDRFFEGIRGFIGSLLTSTEFDLEWNKEVKKFLETYDESRAVFERAKKSWKDVHLARGKGRLAREKEITKESNGTVLF